MDNQSNHEASDVQPSFSHAPAVAFHYFSDGLTAIWWGLVLNLVGLYPLVVLLTSLHNPRQMTTVGSWLLVSLPLILGVIIGSFGIKEKGYQTQSVRVFGILSLSVGILFMMIPLVASLMYGFGIGN